MTLIWRKETIETDVICGFVCNMCGLVVQPGVGTRTVEELESCLEGLVHAQVSGGYGAEHLSDGCTYSFSICEKCLSDLFNQFKVPVTVKGVNDVADLFDNLAPNPELAALAITFTAQEVAGWNSNDDGTPYGDVLIIGEMPERPDDDVGEELGPACSPEEFAERQRAATTALDYLEKKGRGEIP